MSIFNFTRGEWIVSVCLLLMIVAALLFSKFYQYKEYQDYNADIYQKEYAIFLASVQYYEDSLAAVKKNRQKSYPTKDSIPNYYKIDYPKNSGQKEFVKQNKEPSYAIIKVDLNSCDTADIEKVPLFGAKRAAKIMEYRNQLGGFHSFSQLQEIFILQNITIEHFEKYFTINKKKINKIKINQADYNQLIHHPYLDAYLSKTIIQYRTKNGTIHNMSELQKITNAYQELINKLVPYIDFESEEN
ncbi:MAG: helix-hairpin-helix domain-containing protein [Bacteroidales bacterium]|jgi:DNA uptake protein ComE-like DNA-binding protein|nr:helix-hairpin-helix domain-containing protein [Bacteroidales bacterium]